ncbi:MAG: hypothetical protein ACRBB3_08495 [Alphaproteobacteria bacterium]
MSRIKGISLEQSIVHGRERSYIKGVEEASQQDESKILFLDPDKLTSSDPKELLEQLLGQADQQFPENLSMGVSTQDIRDDGEATEAFLIFAQDMKDNGPSALSSASIVIMPSSKHETKEALFTTALEDIYDQETIDRIIKNTPGNDKQWNRIIGNHEGMHLTKDFAYDTKLEQLTEEKRADVGTEEIAENRGDKDIAFALIDLRHLSTRVGVGHATGTPLISDDPISQIHIDKAISYTETIDNIIDANFDWLAHEGDAINTEDLLIENPDAFFATLDKVINEAISTIKGKIDAKEEPLTYEEKEAIVTFQVEVDYIKNFEGAYQRRVLGQDVPEHKPVQLISVEQETAFHAEYALKNKEPDPPPAEQEQENHQKSLVSENNIPEQAFEGFDWESYEGKATTTGGMLLESNDLYFQVQIDYLDKIKDSAIQNYKDDPSHDNTQALIEIQTLINARNASMDQYKEEVLGQKIPAREDITLIPEDKQQAFYEERVRRNTPENSKHSTTINKDKSGFESSTETNHTEEIDNKDPSEHSGQEYNTGINDSAYTTEVSNITSGKLSVNFEHGVNVNGTPISNIFSEMANPSTNDIKLVDARAEPTEEQFTIPTSDVKRDVNLSTNV